MQRYNVAHIITRLELGGAQQNTLYCVTNHDRTRFRSHLLCGPGGLLDQEAGAIQDAEVRFVPVLRHPISPVNDCLAVLRLAGLLRHLAIDLVHTHSSKAGIIGRLAAHLAGTRVVVHTAHGWSFNPTQRPLLRRLYLLLERVAARRTDLLITVSELDRLRGIGLGIGEPGSYQVIRSGIDVECFRQRPAQPLLPRIDGQVAIGTIACFKPQKDLETLIRTAHRVIRRRPRVHFYLAGDGPTRGDLEALCRELGVEKQVHLLGWVRDVRGLLHSLDLFVLTSAFEGLPRALLQAAAARLPIVATAVDGVPELVEHEVSGLLAPSGDDRAIADCLVRLIDDQRLARSLAAAADARLDTGTFEITQMLAQLERCYLQLLEGP